MIPSKVITFFAIASISGLVAASAIVKDVEVELTIAGGGAKGLQQRLLVGGAQETPMDELYFADQLTQSSRRTAAVSCALKKGEVDFFDISVSITPSQSFSQFCRLADQILLGNDINSILLNYGVGDAGAFDDAAYVAGVCIAPAQTTRRRLVTTGFVWKGIGGCRPGMCSFDNSDIRLLNTGSEAGQANGGQNGDVSEWFTNTFKPEMEATLKVAFGELEDLHLKCVGKNPVIDVIVNGASLAEIASAKCPIIGGLGVLDAISFGSIVVGLRQSTCQTCVNLDFSKTGKGKKLERGAYVKNEWYDIYGLTISAVGGYCPNGMARIFDTAKPGDGDRHLGSPNSKCPRGGPGVGVDGEPGQRGANCEPLGSKTIVIYPLSNRNQKSHPVFVSYPIFS